MELRSSASFLAMVIPIMLCIVPLVQDRHDEMLGNGNQPSPSSIRYVNATSDGNNGTINITPREVPLQALEGSLYNASFEPFGNGSSLSIQLNQSGPYYKGWLDADINGSVWGIPMNRDVGIWNMSIILDDGNGNRSEYNWSINVLNVRPQIDPVTISNWTEHMTLTIDLNCTGEGDGYTNYTLIGGNVETFDNITGVLTAIPRIDSIYRTFSATVGVKDGHGGDDVLEIWIPLNNTPPIFLGTLPRTIKAWEQTSVPAMTNEDNIAVIGFKTTPFMPFLTIRQDTNGSTIRYYLELEPLNHDAGERTYKFGVVDNWGGWSNYTWDLRVETNGSATDPEVAVLSAAWHSKDELKIGFAIYSGNGTLRDARITDESGLINQTLYPADQQRGYTLVKVGDMGSGSVNLTLQATFEIGGRTKDWRISDSMVLDPGDRPSGGFDPVPLIIVAVVVILLIVVVLGSLVERTSYAMQTILFKGGSPKDEEVLSAIQAKPGIDWSGLIRTTGVGRRAAIASVLSLESGGYIYEQPIGTGVRFYPMMGSFKDRPLSLSRNQWQVAKAMLSSTRGMDENDISSATGIPPARVRKECNLMELKGAITIIRRPTLDVYRLSGNQRETLKKRIRE
jgi:hypothetical protein